MIQVKVTRNEELLESIEMTGHAGSGPYGYDLVCAAVSGISIGAVNAVMGLTDIDLKVKQGGYGGYLKVTFPSSSHPDMDKAQLLLEGMLVSLKSIEMEYGKFIKIHEN